MGLTFALAAILIILVILFCLIKLYPDKYTWLVIGLKRKETNYQCRTPEEEPSELYKSFETCKPIIQANIMGMLNLFVTTLDELSCVFGKEVDRIAEREDHFPRLRVSLLMDKKHTSNDSKLSNILIGYLGVTNRKSATLVELIRKGQDCEAVNERIYLWVLDVMCEAGMGIDVRAQRGGEKEYVRAVLDLSRLVHKRQILSWLLRPCVFNLTPTGREQNKLLKKVLYFSEKVILQRKNSATCSTEENKTKTALSYLDLLLVDTKESRPKEIQEKVNNFIFSCHDRASATIIWVLFELGHNQDIQELAYLEQRDIFQDSSRAVEMEDLQNMPYMDKILKETYRLYPSTPIVSRRLKTNVKINGHVIPAGTDIPIFVYYIHRSPELYCKPNDFDPDRYLPAKNSRDSRLDSYTPFIFGPKYSFIEEFAIVMEKVILSYILRNFKFTSLDRREDVHLTGDLQLRPKQDLRIAFKPRQHFTR